MNISKVTLEIETSEGDVLKFVMDKPTPNGGNPAYMNRQLETAVDELSRRGHKSLEIFGKQYTPADERLDQLRAERNRSDTS
jgi:hypothetical protein